MNRKSKWLFIVVFFFIIFVSARILIYADFIEKVEHDAKTINGLGIIRGSIQRLTKLEIGDQLEDNIEDNLAIKIDKMIQYYMEQGKKSKHEKYLETEKMVELKLSWGQLKKQIKEYRDNPSEESKHRLLVKSEECWEVADAIVLISQNESEKKISNIKYLILSFGFDLLIIAIILFISKKYVYDNLEVSVLFDPLTKAYNSRYFTENINHEISKASRINKVFSIIMLDIDNFKLVNDTYGHAVGDYVLKEMVLELKKIIRKYDVLSRIGGEEFIIILPDTEIDSAYNLAERIRKAIEDHIFNDVKKVTISIGLTQFQSGDTLDIIMKRTDNALYKAKNNGKNRSEIE